MRVGVKVLPRSEVLDTQGRAVEGVLKRTGHSIASCKIGKYIIVDTAEQTEEAALKSARLMAEQVLYNPLIETFELEILR